MTDAGRTLVFSFDGTGNEPSDAGKFERIDRHYGASLRSRPKTA